MKLLYIKYHHESSCVKERFEFSGKKLLEERQTRFLSAAMKLKDVTCRISKCLHKMSNSGSEFCF